MDDSAAGVVAARVAARMTAGDGVLTLVSVDDASITRAGLFPTAVVPAQAPGRAGHALREAAAEAEPIHGLWARRRTGEPVAEIVHEVEERGATLLVIGSHGYRRATGIAFGLVGSRLLHEARCSVLVALPEHSPERWPLAIVAGVDGSVQSAAAAAAARDLADRFGASLRLVACAGGHIDLDAARAIGPDVEVLPSSPVDGLHALSDAADLIVIGSRGLHGLRALGSVSERVAHRSRCSVLVLRPVSRAR